jgi:GMP synthase (glutamine-hydrolysing)
MSLGNTDSRVLVVIDPGVHTPEIDTFNLISVLSSIPCTYHLPAMFGFGTLPDNLSTIAGVIILGSAASVYDNLPWQRPLEAFVASVVDRGIPVLGCCYGLQMLAYMFGGRVGYVRESKEKLKGVRRINVLNNPIWSPGERDVIVTHSEMVTELPRDFEILATSPEVPVEGMQHKVQPVYGFQCHPEATRLFLVGHEMLDDKIQLSLPDGRHILERFVHMVTEA